MILGAFITVLNQTIMSVAIPELISAFNIAATTALWLTTGYMLVNGVFIPLTAYLMQRFTTRELFLSAMLAFLVGSILSSVAPGFELLLIGRLVQAAGAGIIMPLLMNVVLAIFPKEKRGGAIKITHRPHNADPPSKKFAVVFVYPCRTTPSGLILKFTCQISIPFRMQRCTSSLT
ncbi:hypothetical protein PSTEL_18890 [Paenibacillus stellifer]|uniref:Major facilitator superfamily (MFS) profile domain-containing protein n=1 Tax=Paenibacillus stellifer TaxID=169760 RepID=A0A089LXN2_9BACL|nr:hypothetical protein PSTEL_18890 [Paenibacillus stellifer]